MTSWNEKRERDYREWEGKTKLPFISFLIVIIPFMDPPHGASETLAGERAWCLRDGVSRIRGAPLRRCGRAC